MANFDSIGEFGLGQVLSRRLTTPGGAVAPTVAPELFPVLTLENDRPEWGQLKGEIICSKYDSAAAVAAQYGQFQLYLPSNVSTIAVVTSIKSHNANFLSVARGVGIGGGVAGWAGRTTANRDFRMSGQNTAVILERRSDAVLPSVFPGITMLGAAGDTYDEPIVITPGTSLIVYAQTVNQEVRITFNWRERAAQPGEI